MAATAVPGMLIAAIFGASLSWSVAGAIAGFAICAAKLAFGSKNIT